ncbi:hypothetical protein KM043_003282 [Ampulex compressa]|nr:hypothetical protein KM043_003282 [Ampulex compressa]
MTLFRVYSYCGAERIEGGEDVAGEKSATLDGPPLAGGRAAESLQPGLVGEERTVRGVRYVLRLSRLFDGRPMIAARGVRRRVLCSLLVGLSLSLSQREREEEGGRRKEEGGRRKEEDRGGTPSLGFSGEQGGQEDLIARDSRFEVAPPMFSTFPTRYHYGIGTLSTLSFLREEGITYVWKISGRSWCCFNEAYRPAHPRSSSLRFSKFGRNDSFAAQQPVLLAGSPKNPSVAKGRNLNYGTSGHFSISRLVSRHGERDFGARDGGASRRMRSFDARGRDAERDALAGLQRTESSGRRTEDSKPSSGNSSYGEKTNFQERAERRPAGQLHRRTITGWRVLSVPSLGFFPLAPRDSRRRSARESLRRSLGRSEGGKKRELSRKIGRRPLGESVDRSWIDFVRIRLGG